MNFRYSSHEFIFDLLATQLDNKQHLTTASAILLILEETCTSTISLVATKSTSIGRQLRCSRHNRKNLKLQLVASENEM